jgi:hypothetical protein
MAGAKAIRRIPMLKGTIGLLTVIFVAGSSLAYAQDASRPQLSQADMNALTDGRIAFVKAASAT